MAARPPTSTDDITFFCFDCDYNLTGIEADRCPECGAEIDRDAIRAGTDYALRGLSESTRVLLLSVPALTLAVMLGCLALEWEVAGAFVGAMLMLMLPYGLVAAYYVAWRMRIRRHAQAGVNPYAQRGRVRFALDFFVAIAVQASIMMLVVIIVAVVASEFARRV